MYMLELEILVRVVRFYNSFENFKSMRKKTIYKKLVKQSMGLNYRFPDNRYYISRKLNEKFKNISGY